MLEITAYIHSLIKGHFRETYQIPSNIDGTFILGSDFPVNDPYQDLTRSDLTLICWKKGGITGYFWPSAINNTIGLVFDSETGLVVDEFGISDQERKELVSISEIFVERLRELKSKDSRYNMCDSFHSVLSDPELFRERKIEMIL